MRRVVLAVVLVFHSVTLATGQSAKATAWLADPSHAARIAAAERDIVAVVPDDAEPLRLTLQRWMELYKIPGLSVAVFDQHTVIWAKAYGVKEAGQSDRVTLDTLFQAGSISKPVTAMAALHFVETGRWSLDEAINTRLVSWKLPLNDLQKDQKVTLRRLLSHNAGTTVHGFPGYAVGNIGRAYGWKGLDPEADAPSVTADLLARLKGLDHAIAWYRAAHAAGGKGFGPGFLNSLGYRLLQAGQVADAVKVFGVNVELYPDDANAYDSLGEGQMAAGNTKAAIANYRKSLEMDPKNENAKKMLQRLEGK